MSLVVLLPIDIRYDLTETRWPIVGFTELGEALNILSTYEMWCEDNVISVIDEIICEYCLWL